MGRTERLDRKWDENREQTESAKKTGLKTEIWKKGEIKNRKQKESWNEEEREVEGYRKTTGKQKEKYENQKEKRK